MTKKKFLGHEPIIPVDFITAMYQSKPQALSIDTDQISYFPLLTSDLRCDEVFLNTKVGARHSLYSTKLPSLICQHILPLYVVHSKIRGLVTSAFLQAISSAFSYTESSSVCSAGEHPEMDSIFPESVGFQSHRPCLKLE